MGGRSRNFGILERLDLEKDCTVRKDGFTLMELVVTMACAGIVALVAFGVWKSMHGDYVRLQRDYQTSTGALLQDLIQTKNRVVVNPDPKSISNRY